MEFDNKLIIAYLRLMTTEVLEIKLRLKHPDWTDAQISGQIGSDVHDFHLEVDAFWNVGKEKNGDN